MNIRPLFLFRSLYLRRARDAAFAEPLVAQREMIVADDPADASAVRRPDNPITMSDVENTISHPARVCAGIRIRCWGNCWVCRRSRLPT